MRYFKFRERVWLGIKVSLLVAVLALLVGLGVVELGVAAQNDCDKLLSQKTFKTLGKAKNTQIQNSLVILGYDPKKIDGIIGPHTKAALKQFCADVENEFRKDSVDDFMAALLLYVAIAKVYPAWKDIVLNDQFKDWVNQQPAGKSAAYRIIMRTSPAGEIISLYEEYQSDLEKDTEKARKRQFGEKENYVVSYKLTEKDLEDLKAEKDITAKLKDVMEKDKSYYSKENFIVAVQKAVSLPEDELKLVIENAQQDNYILTEKSFKKLNKNKKIPQAVVDGLNKLKDKEPQAEDEFKTEVMASIEEVIQVDQYQPLFLKYAKVEGPYRISAEYLAKLEKKKVPDDVIAKLRTLPKKPYKNIDLFKEAVRPIIEDVTKKDNFPDSAISDFAGLRDKDLEKQRKGANKIVREERDDYINYQKIIIQEIDELPLYRLTAQSKKKLKKGGVPDFLIVKLRELVGNGYTDEFTFKSALNKKIEELYKGYQDTIVGDAEKIVFYQMSESAFEKLEEEIQARAISDDVMAKLQSLQDTEYPDKNLFVNALKAVTRVATSKMELTIVNKAEKKHPLDESTVKPFKWNAKTCGCLRDDLSGVVYGFYPYWMAGDQDDQKKDEKAGEQNRKEADNQNEQSEDDEIIEHELDFSVLTRIGFYALSFNEKGDINEKLPWAWKAKGKLFHWQKSPAEIKAEKAAKFLKVAHKHRTDVDLVIYQDWSNQDWLNQDWSNMASDGKKQIFENLMTNIIDLVNIELTDTFSLVKPYISFGGSPIPTIADGVTLYFKNYPVDDDDSKYLLVEFIKKLRKNLKDSNRHYYLNIMLHMDDLGKGVYEIKVLKQFVPSIDKREKDYEDNNYVDHYLVFIGEPTTKTKKDLRNNVENLFHDGQQRSNMLQKIIPIIKPTVSNEKQLIEDIIYFKNNYGGIGFWPLPLTEGGGVALMTCLKEILPGVRTDPEEKRIPKEKWTLAEVVNFNLKENYRREGAEPISGYKNFVTLHRWGGRVIFDVLLAVIAVYALLSAIFCSFRLIFKRFFWPFLAVVLLFIWVFFSLLYFDPSWKNMAEGNLILFLTILVFVVVAILMFVKKSRQGDLP